MKNTKYKNKFIFTQISAPIIGLAGVLFSVYFSKKFLLLPDLNEIPNAVIFGGILLCILAGSMFLWGKALVLFGVLTKEEAKGYPFAKPWEERIIQ